MIDQMLTGPNGERRPTFRVAATISALAEIVAKYEDPPDDREPATHPVRRGREIAQRFPAGRAERSERVPA